MSVTDKRILASRRWHIDGKWFAPREFIKKNFSSVVYCDYMEMSSSAGDWSGLIIQRLNGRLHAVVFYQKNSYPRRGFDVETQSPPIVTVPHTKCESPATLFGQVCRMIFNDESDKISVNQIVSG